MKLLKVRFKHPMMFEDGNLTIQKAAAEADMTVTQFEEKYLK